MSLPNVRDDYLSEHDYLESEKNSPVKREYIDGYVYAMAGASKNHQRIIVSLASRLNAHLAHTPCEVFSSDIKVRVDSNYFYPDVIVVCSNEDEDPYYTRAPRIIVEVLSGSTRKYDRTLKRRIYQTIPSLEEYVLIEQDRVEIEVCRRLEHWQSTFYYIDDEITFTSVGLTLPVTDIYQRVVNDDMRAFYNNAAPVTI